MTLSPEDTAALVGRAARGDRLAWERLVDAYGGLIWAIARNHRLSHGDAADVSQTTWLRLIENVGRLTDPGRVGSWLATTARRECLRLVARQRRTVAVALPDMTIDPLYGGERRPEDDLISAEHGREVQQAIDELPPRCGELLRLLMVDPTPCYEDISAALGIPIGSIGPTRGRCLEKLKAIVAGSGIEAVGTHSL